jgi:hypothetical protein
MLFSRSGHGGWVRDGDAGRVGVAGAVGDGCFDRVGPD